MRRFLILLLFPALILAQNALLPPELHKPFLDQNGKPLNGGKIYTCVAGTLCPGNPLATYQDSAATIPNANPVILDYTGWSQIRLGAGLSYKLVAQNAAGVQQWTLDNVQANTASFNTIGSGINTIGNMVVSSGASLGYTGGGTINASSLGGVSASGYANSDLSNLQPVRHSIQFATDSLYDIGQTGSRPNNGDFGGLVTATSLLTTNLTVVGSIVGSTSVTSGGIAADWFGPARNFGSGGVLAQGSYLFWNFTGSGETDYVNNKGLGVGGFLWYNVSAGIGGAPLMTLLNTGALSVGSISTASGSISGGAISGSSFTGHVNSISYGHMTSSSCPTGTTDGFQCAMTVTWNRAFPDNQYSASCSIIAPTGHPHIEGITSKTTTSVVVLVSNGSAAQAVVSGGAGMDCTGIEN